MKHRLLFISLLVLSTLVIGVTAGADDYYPSLVPSHDGYATLSWTVVETPTEATELYWMEGGAFLATNGSMMSFTIMEIDSYVEGELTIGNFTGTANNTEIAQDLLLSVWGITPFFPGLVVKIGTENLNALNETAYASASRVQGNYLNGTMISSYEVVSVGGVSYDCLVFDYQQDPSGFGVPQETYLAYDTLTGILIKAETSVIFTYPYKLVLEFRSLTTSTPVLLIVAVVSTGVVIILVLIFVKIRMK